MKAGRSGLECGTRVQITHIASPDPVAQDLVGATGVLVPLIQGLMRGSPDRYVAGIILDRQHAQMAQDQYNLVDGDEVRPLPERSVVAV